MSKKPVVVTVTATKGGVGKTTLVVHWAVEALRRHKKGKVAIIDTDPQRSAATWRERRASEELHVLEVPAGRFKDAVQACAEDGFELVLLDTRPSLEEPAIEASKEAMIISDLIVVPCGPSIFDMDALGVTMDLIRETKSKAVMVLNKGISSSNVNKDAMKALEIYKTPICPTIIMNRVALSKACSKGKAVCEAYPKDKATREISDSWKWIKKQYSKES